MLNYQIQVIDLIINLNNFTN